MKPHRLTPPSGDLYSPVNTPSVEHDNTPVDTPIDLLTAAAIDTMAIVNDAHATIGREQLDTLTGDIAILLNRMAVTRDTLKAIELDNDGAALSNRVVAREIQDLRNLQDTYLSAMGLNQETTPLYDQLAHLQAQIDQEISKITINTPDGQQPIDFSVLESEKKLPTYAPYLGRAENIGPIVDAEEITDDEQTAAPVSDNATAAPAPQQTKPTVKAESPNNFSAATKTPNNFSMAAENPNNFSMAAEAPKDTGNDFSAADQQITITPIFRELAKKYGITLDEPIADNPNNFSMATPNAPGSNGNNFSMATPTPENSDNNFSMATVAPENSGNNFSMATAASKSNGNNFSMATTAPSSGNANNFSMATATPENNANNFSMATAPTPEQRTQPEQLSRMEKIKKGLFVASMKLRQMPQKMVEGHTVRKTEKATKRAQETERERRKRHRANWVLGGLATGVAVVGVTAAYSLARQYGWFDGLDSGSLGDAVPDVNAPQYDYQPGNTSDLNTLLAPDMAPPAGQLPDTLDLSEYNKAFTVRFGGGGAELMQQLGVRPEQALSEWKQIAPDLLDAFPSDFYSKPDDGSIAGIMRPGELPEDVQRFIATKLGLK